MINEALEDLAIDIDSVGFDPSNARKHDAKNIEAIKASLSKFGQRSPIVVQKQGMIARAGNGRLEAVYSNTPSNSKDINHPCPKPLALWAWMLERLKFDRKKHILDPFAGSGTTILAAEKAGFGAIGIEMSPAYCDIIIKRWESATGLKAELDG
tara:strand:- start:6684 stop:7145 length:462 start_codon:yes stop_codon:yes gene_type:complete